jgi:hypothetical protein
MTSTRVKTTWRYQVRQSKGSHVPSLKKNFDLSEDEDENEDEEDNNDDTRTSTQGNVSQPKELEMLTRQETVMALLCQKKISVAEVCGELM